MVGRDIWVKYTPKQGDPHVAHHRVWDVGRFMAGLEAETLKTGTKAELVVKPSLRK
jgi:hypothetical protein